MKYVVTYENGDVKEYKVKPRHLVQHEHETKKDGDDTLTKGYKLAWIAAQSEVSFKQWLDLVDDVDVTDVAEVSADPDGGSEPVPTR